MWRFYDQQWSKSAPNAQGYFGSIFGRASVWNLRHFKRTCWTCKHFSTYLLEFHSFCRVPSGNSYIWVRTFWNFTHFVVYLLEFHRFCDVLRMRNFQESFFEKCLFQMWRFYKRKLAKSAPDALGYFRSIFWRASMWNLIHFRRTCWNCKHFLAYFMEFHSFWRVPSGLSYIWVRTFWNLIHFVAYILEFHRFCDVLHMQNSEKNLWEKSLF